MASGTGAETEQTVGPEPGAAGDRTLVVIDGPAGAGKTTVARRLARALGVPLLDTGAIYRTLALVAERRGVAWDDEAALVLICRDFPLTFTGDSGGPQKVSFAGEDVTTAIRQGPISQGASKVSALPGVRAALLEIQRVLGARGCVAEGRDVGTVVFPHARHKFFLTADPQTRAARRRAELIAAGGEAPPLAVVMAEIAERDARDSGRAVAPLRAADDAVVIDTSGLDADGVVERLLAHLRADGVNVRA